MKDRRVGLERRSSTAKGLTVMAMKEQMEKRKLMRMRGQSSGPIMLKLRKNNPMPDVFMQHLSVEVTGSECLGTRAGVWGSAHE